MARIVLVVNHELIRIGLRTVLSQHPSTGEIVDIANLSDIYELASIRPDILIYQIDSSGPARTEGDHELHEDGTLRPKRSEASRSIQTTISHIDSFRESFPHSRIGLMSTHFELEYLLYVLYGKAQAYLPANVSPDELLAAVQAIDCGGVYIHSQLMAQLPQNLLRLTTAPSKVAYDMPQLSEREHEVLSLLVKGYTNKEVSEQLYLSPKTVEAYRAKLYNKLGVRTRADLFSFATERGLVTI
ncbi:MAG: response regulator transcription factor [Coriobacteriia bacterium]|nr:response regulator transcription factor [Coriobacteriia bacterium]